MKHAMYYLSALILVLCFSCTKEPKTKEVAGIIPKPEHIKVSGKSFELASDVVIVASDPELEKIGQMLGNYIKQRTGLSLKQASENTANAVILGIDESIGNKEGYSLSVSGKNIEIKGAQPAGVFYGVQSLIQLIPMNNNGKEIAIPAVKISDQPRFSWRGMHLDVSRHFFDKEFIKKYIDMLAMHKLNVFHWHLVDDQGWRIEIKQYPKLTEVGAWREDREDEKWALSDDQRHPYPEGKPYYGGFYTQEEIKEIVQYAQDRFITVVPEIEMPGHSRAALVAYPEFSCFGYETKVPSAGFVGENWDFSDPFCAGKDTTFVFLQNVLDEVMQLFPSEYIHIGGDECSKRRWKQCPECQARIEEVGLKDEFELQSYFIRRIEKYLNDHDRKIIGWQEILEGGMNQSATIMPWKGNTALEVCKEAAEKGHDVIMAPSSHLYFNGSWPDQTNRGGLSLEKVYSYDPIPQGLTKEQHKYIIGLEACAWSEHMHNPDDVEYQVIPRMAALAEVGWTQQKKKDWQSFHNRLQELKADYDMMDINYHIPSPQGLEPKVVFVDKAIVTMEAPDPELAMHYTLDGITPSINTKEYMEPFDVTTTTTITAACIDQYANKSKLVKSLYEKQEYRKPEQLEDVNKGLTYYLHRKRFRTAEKVQKANAEQKGTTDTIAMVETNDEQDAGLLLEGYVNVPEKGIYTFYTASDDGSLLFIGDKLIVDNDGFHGGKTRDGELILKSGKIALDKGLHPIIIKYFDWEGGELLKGFISGPGLEKQEISKDMLFN